MAETIWSNQQFGMLFLFDENGHMQETELEGQRRKRLSVETWLTAASARQALLDGKVTWGDWENAG
jgi:hypothetical protein